MASTSSSKIKLDHQESNGQMRGWFKLIETIRQTEPTITTPRSNELSEVSSLSPTTTPIRINELPCQSPASSPIDEVSSVTLHSPTPLTPEESSDRSSTPTVEKRSSTRHKRITIRKSTRTREQTSPSRFVPLTNPTKSSRLPSAEAATAPSATNLRMLPGYQQDDQRDLRFIDYDDPNTLSTHFHSCFHIEKKSSISRQLFFKTRHNALSKIFKIDQFKNPVNKEKNIFEIQSAKTNDQPCSTTSLAFRSDWSAKRHRSSRKNLFHTLQANPKRSIFEIERTTTNLDRITELPLEQIKDILFQTYYPRLAHAVRVGFFFGAKPALLLNNESQIISHNSIENEQQLTGPRKKRKENELQIETNRKQRRLSVEILPAMKIEIEPTITQPIDGKQRLESQRKRGRTYPITTETKKRKIQQEDPLDRSSSSSKREPESSVRSNSIRSGLRSKQKIDGENSLKQKRSEVVVVPSKSDDETSNRFESPRKAKFSESFEEIEENIFSDESFRKLLVEENNESDCWETNYDWPSIDENIRQHRTFAGLEVFRREKKVFAVRSQVEIDSGEFLCEYVGEIVFREKNSKNPHSLRLNKNLIIDASRKGNFTRFLRHSTTANCFFEKRIVDRSPHFCLFSSRLIRIGEELTFNHQNPFSDIFAPKQKPVVYSIDDSSQVRKSSIFLQRNLRRIREKFHVRSKQKQVQLDEEPVRIFPSKFYHSSHIDNDTKVTHRDLFNVFYNFIRRSHFAKTGRCSLELIDPTCYYAHLAQLTYVLHQIFESILSFKCFSNEICPSNALKRCPSKRLFPVYYELIKSPIDLRQIRFKLDSAEYFSFDAFENDLILLFNNAKNYCGEESEVGRAVNELQIFYHNRLKVKYRSIVEKLKNFPEKTTEELTWKIFTKFLQDFHQREIFDGDIRQTVYRIVFTIDFQTPPLSNSFRLNKDLPVVHCRCGSTFDETNLVQCYGCQLWQHVSCVFIADLSQVYFCFECQATCQNNPSACLKNSVCISLPSSSKYFSTLTRSDGYSIRINECYQIRKENKLQIFCVERLWIDENDGLGRADGFYYRRPNEIFNDGQRKFYRNELIRCPSNGDVIPLSSIERSCFVLDVGTFSKGKPLSDFTKRLTSNDVFVCEFRLDKSSRLVKAKHIGVNMKSYCFDHYMEKLTMKRENSSNVQRRSNNVSMKFNAKQFEEKSSRIDGVIEKIYCRYHPSISMPEETKLSIDDVFLKGHEYDSLENSDQHLVGSLLNQLIELVCCECVSSQSNENQK